MKAERNYPRYTVTAKAEAAILRGHPWVYDAEITATEGQAENGGLVDVINKKGRYLGTGFLSEQSKIRVRLVSRNANDQFDAAFWRRKLQWAWEYRKRVMSPEDLDACRIIFGEADAFPGLTVDKFHDLLSVQVLSVGMERIQDILLPALAELLRADGFPIRGILLRNDVALREKEGLPQGKGWYPLPGEAAPDSAVTEITENGVKYLVDVENGQKTGFFLDQKYNRLAVSRICAGKHVLDCFTHTGPFALNAAKGGAASVTAVDISEAALRVAKKNARRLFLIQKGTARSESFQVSEDPWCIRLKTWLAKGPRLQAEIEEHSLTLLQSNLFQAVEADVMYDVIVSNPPYIPSAVIDGLEPEVRDHEPRLALDGSEDGLYFYRVLALECSKHLNKGGCVYFEIGYDQAEAVSRILTIAGYREIEVIKDEPGLNRVVKARWNR